MRTERSVILANSLRPLLPTAFLFSFYLLFTGHNAPGGGFIGGLVAGAGLVLRFVDKGYAGLSQLQKANPRSILSLGLLIVLITAVTPWIFGNALLESAHFEVETRWFGTVKGTSSLLFDAGVYLIVLGLVAEVLKALSSQEPE